MILCDLPYNITAAGWDKKIPLNELWAQYERIKKKESAIVLFGCEPFASELRMSNIKNYKYDWIWRKTKIVNYLNAKRQPLREYEAISVFYSKKYYPQGLCANKKGFNVRRAASKTLHKHKLINKSEYSNYPRNILEFKSEQGYHPTQKPVPLLEYLIKTYTKENEIVLDNCMGSGSTGVACVKTNRDFIGIELDKKYYEIAKERINNALKIKGGMCDIH